MVVKTDKGKTVESRPLKFRADTALPEISIDDYSDSHAINGLEKSLTITGKVSCETGVGGLKYRIMSAIADIQKGVIASITAPISLNSL